jgi:hypothetical protein
MLVKTFSFGDKVVHSGRPEWGTGTVAKALPDTHEGKVCQRLEIRFERVGLKTLSTGIATLIPAEDAPALLAQQVSDPLSGSRPGDAPSAGLGPTNDRAVRELMTRLPDTLGDPFLPIRARLDIGIKLYRYNEHGGSLLDWAAAQSGLKDPMTRFSRHELEDLFRRWAMSRDEALKKLVFEAKKADPTGLSLAMRGATGKAQSMLKRFDTGR